MSPFKNKGNRVLLIKLDRNTLMKIKLYSFGFVYGFKSFYAIIVTITIRIMFVTVDSKDAATCTMFDIKIVCYSSLHKLEIASLV